VNGAQQISADGAYGRQGDSLKVAVDNVDVALVDTLLRRPPQLSGRLNAVATVTSTASQAGRTPLVDATFTVDMGGFQKFRYDSFGGTIDYTGTGVVLDTRLQANPTTWLTAKGHVPMSLFGGAGSLAEPVDVHIDSTPIDVALVQGVTSQLTNVKGTLEAHVGITGTAGDPRPDGSITIQNAAFTLESTGVVYTGLDGRIDLQPDRVHIDQIRVLDNQSKPLTVTGDLALRERRVGEMTISAKADDFKVIDNKLGNVRINSNLTLTGQLNAPRVEGSVGVTTGQINLDEILALVGNSPYATAPTEYTTSPVAVDAGNPLASPESSPAAQAARPQGSASTAASAGAGSMQSLQVDVQMTVPDDLVIKANDLRAPGAPISLGALNLTLGGNLYVQQVPYDKLRLYGAINTVRGTYTFQGRQFTILRDGTIRFEGLDQMNPTLDLRTERVIQAVTANVNVRGTLDKPEIELSSTPPLEQADILSLIVFNQPINQLGEGEQISLGQRAQQLATGAVASQLAQSIGNALNLNTFEINTAPDSGATAELTVGQQVGQNLYVKVQQDIGDQSQTNFILEYELAAWLRLQTNVLQGSSTQQQLFKRAQGSGVDLLFFFSY
jgi:translocation and assembly module TamB